MLKHKKTTIRLTWYISTHLALCFWHNFRLYYYCHDTTSCILFFPLQWRITSAKMNEAWLLLDKDENRMKDSFYYCIFYIVLQKPCRTTLLRPCRLWFICYQDIRFNTIVTYWWKWFYDNVISSCISFWIRVWW